MLQRILTGGLFLLLLGFASCNSCNSEKSKPASTQTAFESQLTQSDTAEVKAVVDKFFSALIQKDYYGAAGLLYTRNLPKGQNQPELLNNKELEEAVAFFKVYPYVGYEVEYIKFHEVEQNEVRCRVILRRGENGQPDAYTYFTFTPIYNHCEWRLIMTDTSRGERTVVKPEQTDSMRQDYAQRTGAQGS